MKLLIDLHKRNPRQGPGGAEATRRALRLAELPNQPLQVADIGCGTGASTLILAEQLNAKIIAVDLFQDFLDVLSAAAQNRGVAHKITPLAASMAALPFPKGSLDLIWAEGSIYHIGFKNGIEYFRRFLKPGGILAVSEITWLAKERPEEIQKYWNAEYPEMATAAEKMRILESQGFVIKGYFPLAESCWLENYYTPLEKTFAAFLAKHDSEDAKALVEAEKTEIALYKKYRAYYSYGFYIAQKI